MPRLDEILPWIDARKRQVVAELATAMQAPETVGPNLWGALKELASAAGQQADTGNPEQNSRNAMSGFGVGSIHNFPGPKVPTYSVAELPQTPGLMSKFLSESQQQVYSKLVAAGQPPEKALLFAKMQP